MLGPGPNWLKIILLQFHFLKALVTIRVLISETVHILTF